MVVASARCVNFTPGVPGSKATSNRVIKKAVGHLLFSGALIPFGSESLGEKARNENLRARVARSHTRECLLRGSGINMSRREVLAGAASASGITAKRR